MKSSKTNFSINRSCGKKLSQDLFDYFNERFNVMGFDDLNDDLNNEVYIKDLPHISNIFFSEFKNILLGSGLPNLGIEHNLGSSSLNMMYIHCADISFIIYTQGKRAEIDMEMNEDHIDIEILENYDMKLYNKYGLIMSGYFKIPLENIQFIYQLSVEPLENTNSFAEDFEDQISEFGFNEINSLCSNNIIYTSDTAKYLNSDDVKKILPPYLNLIDKYEGNFTFPYEDKEDDPKEINSNGKLFQF